MKVIQRIDQGGFGKVEKVQLDDGQIVARKTFQPIPSNQVDIDKLRCRFTREVRVQSQLPKELFMPILDCDLNSNTPWYIMPLADKNYDEQIREERHNGKPSYLPLADILESLEMLHRLEYVHRDLKPSNILFHNGKWKLADLGFVLPLGNQTPRVTSEHSKWGSYPYMAPEQARDFANVSTAADIYAFGCILHDLFDGGCRCPFAKQSCSGPIGFVIEKCTEIEPEQRFKNIAQLRSALVNIIQPNKSDQHQEEVDWVDDIKNIAVWDEAHVRDFVQFLQSTYEVDEIYRALDEDAISSLYQNNPHLWQNVALCYCKWARKSFPWAYSDVIAGRLARIYQLGSLEVKTAAVIATAVLGDSHNRWYVMRCLMRMCGSSMDLDVAQRTAIEIIAQDEQEAFRACARKLNESLGKYHTTIRSVLE